MIPRATYRVQFHAGFTFADAIPLAPYWASLGVTHLYASPIAAARKGSTHGYDAIDPTQVNPYLGGEQGFVALATALRNEGLGIILDIVPNHLAVGGSENAWWLDVLEKGQASPYARAFDIDWAPADPGLHGKVLAPFLGAPYGEVLASGELRMTVDPAADRLAVTAYGAHIFPIRREDHAAVLQALGASSLAEVDGGALETRFDGREPEGRQRLHDLLERQHYRLAWWRTAGDEINWRRFFDITELAGLRMEDPAVFDIVHELPLRLYAEGLIDGVRVDHVDGLADPAGYCRRLRDALDARTSERPADRQGPAYLIVEKILGAGETLPIEWGTDGTSGYEFMNEVSALLHAPEAAEPLARLWAETSGRPADFAAEENAARQEILHRGFAGQLDTVAAAFHRLAQRDVSTRDVGLASFRRAVAAVIGALRVYRTYGLGDRAPESDAPFRDAAVEEALHAAPQDAAAIRLIGRWLAGAGPGELAPRRDAVRRFQQLSAPIAAKAVEDTAFYRYGRLLSRNDVGFDPARFSTSPAAFLRLCAERGVAYPAAMLTTATHDHKRGEDVRARLAALSEMSEAWQAYARRRLPEASAAQVDPGDALMLHQTILGAWPLDLAASDAGGLEAFAERVSAWQAKALREAKLRSNWAEPDADYEGRCEAYLRHVLVEPGGAAVRQEIAGILEQLAPVGAAKGLVQAGLRLTMPGVPDLYQGCEYWDLSLVDPDNRRPVDFGARQASLDRDALDWRTGVVKQRLIAALLRLRREHPAVFTKGGLEPLPLEGLRASEAMAFSRGAEGEALVALCALRLSPCAETGRPALPPSWWGDTTVRLGPGETVAAADLAGEAPFAATILAR